MLTSDESADSGVERAIATGIDAVALKPAECDVSRAANLPFDDVVIDWEGLEHFPGEKVLSALARTATVRVTTPVRADGFDPLGDDRLLAHIPEDVGRVLVAGHPAYLNKAEQSRAVAPRLGAAATQVPEAWVGTENVERIALATGNGQYELLTPSTRRDVRALRAAGFDGEIAVYAPTVLDDEEDALLDAVGGFVSRRPRIARALPDGSPTDASVTGRAREVLLAGIDDFALAGSVETVREQVEALKAVGVDTVVGYPARGLDTFGG